MASSLSSSSSSSSSTSFSMNGGQSISDRVNAARYALSGQGVHRVVCKATTEEVLAPKKKHLDYLIQCTHEANVSIPSLAHHLMDRTTNSSWVVVFKALITTHHLMCYGNERFSAFVASSSSSLFSHVTSFMDKSNALSMDMSPFVRRYARYVNNKGVAYRSTGTDLAKRSASNSLRSMPSDKMLKTLPILQSLVDSLLDFDAHARDLRNGVMTAAFVLLYRDLIRLFAAFNDGIINLLEKFFSLKVRREARAALDLYKRFLVRMDRVSEFLKTAEAVGIDRGDIPDLTRAPSSLLEALEAHCLALEGKSVTSSSVTSSSVTSSSVTEEDECKRALEEEALLLQHFQQRLVHNKQEAKGGPTNNTPVTTASNADPFLSFNDDNNDDTTQCLMTSSSGGGSAGGVIDNNKKVAADILALFESNSTNMNNMTLSGSTFGGFSTPVAPFPSPAHHHHQSNPFLVSSSSMVSQGHPALPAAPRMAMMMPTTTTTTTLSQEFPVPAASSNASFEANFASAFPSNSSSTKSAAKKSTTEEFLSQDFSLI